MGWLFNKKLTDEELENIYKEAEKYHYGVKWDFRKAAKLYKKAAKQGHADSQYKLGEMYYNGYGVLQDYDKTVELYKKAADQGHVDAQFNLGLMYEKGDCVRQNYDKAKELYRKAADQGDARAQYNLGYMYDIGRGGFTSHSMAYHLYIEAAAQGIVAAYNNLGYIYELGKGGVTQNYHKAVKAYKIAADQGYAEAQYNLGYMYEKGYGVDKDLDKAMKLYKKAADQGYAAARSKLDSINESKRAKAQTYSNSSRVVSNNSSRVVSNNSSRVVSNNSSSVAYNNTSYSSTAKSSSNKAWLEQAEYYLDRGYESRAIAIIEEAASKGDPDAKELLYKFYKGKREIEDKYARQETINLVNQLADVILENAENERQKTIKELEDLKRDLEIEEYRAKERYQREKMYAEIEVEREIKKALENRK